MAIGLIDISYGGASILTFMDESTIEWTADSVIFNEIKRTRRQNYLMQISMWEKSGHKGKRPKFPVQQIPVLCYNAMVHPVIPFANRGAIWYQGESNASYPESYVAWFGDYISMMRGKFNKPEMPFYFVQLAGFENQHNTSVPPEIWAKFRLAQEECMKYPNTGMATAMDIGMEKNIHPKNKQEIGKRLAFCALNQTYGKTGVVFRGPQLRSIEKKGRTLILTFDHCDGGLRNKDNSKNIKGFSAVSVKGEVITLEGKIRSANTVEIKARDLERLRYAYANYPHCSLYNGAGLPALSFDREVK